MNRTYDRRTWMAVAALVVGACASPDEELGQTLGGPTSGLGGEGGWAVGQGEGLGDAGSGGSSDAGTGGSGDAGSGGAGDAGTGDGGTGGDTSGGTPAAACGANGCESGLGETCTSCPADCGACTSSARITIVTVKPNGGGDYRDIYEARAAEARDISRETGSNEIVRFLLYSGVDKTKFMAKDSRDDQWKTGPDNPVELWVVGADGKLATFTGSWRDDLYVLHGTTRSATVFSVSDQNIHHLIVRGPLQVIAEGYSSDWSGIFELHAPVGYQLFEDGGILQDRLYYNPNARNGWWRAIKSDKGALVRFKNWKIFGNDDSRLHAGVANQPYSTGRIELIDCEVWNYFQGFLLQTGTGSMLVRGSDFWNVTELKPDWVEYEIDSASDHNRTNSTKLIPATWGSHSLTGVSLP